MYLNCHTGFSFSYGTMPPKELFAEAKRCGVHKLALTEINNTASCLEMLRLCNTQAPDVNGLNKYGKPGHSLDIAIGVEFRNESELLYIALARNNDGFEEINRFLSYHKREEKPFPVIAPAFQHAFIIYSLGKHEPETLRSNEFVGVRLHQLNQFSRTPWQQWVSKFVVLHPVTFLPPTRKKNGKPSNVDFNTHRLLRAVSKNTLLSKLPKYEEAHPGEFMLPEDELENRFAEFPNLIENTKRVLNACSIDLEMHADKNRKCFATSKQADLDLLRTETLKGFRRVYGENGQVWARIEKELSIIERKEFTAYYLIAYDLIRFANEKSYDYVGRGSGANSTVAYCLGITNVDPIELNLYFERFLNEDRTTPPDFDIDFSWDNRNDIYDYLFSKYGTDHVALLGTHVTYQWRSILRELAKVFGLPKDEIDELVENPSEISKRDHIKALVFRYASYIVKKELPSNISIHAGGVIITEKPIYAYTATDLPAKGYPVTHFEMHGAEDFGIFKFDILSQRGLGHIKETVKQIRRNKGLDVDVYRFPEFKRDEKIKELLRAGKTMGCFYVESPATRMLLGKLRCEDYLTLVAASSIIRPGVASSGMMRAYIERFHTVRNGGKHEAIHPKMDELMAETFGVMVYQEDVIKVAHEFAGITLTEADVLRRGMSGKYRSREEFQRVKDRFFEECRKRKYKSHIIDRVWYEIESFAGYSFAKGHSASYAVESYQSLFLKAHYPLEFMVGVINNFGGFYKTEFYFHEARMNGAIIEPPCVNQSDRLTTIYDRRIFIGFIHLISLESKTGKLIEDDRKKCGPYKSLTDFLERITIGLEQIRILIRIGAFRFTGKPKQRLLWEAMLHYSQARSRSKTTNLFNTEPKLYPLPQLTRNETEDAFDEIELLGFPLCDPYTLLGSKDRGDTLAKDLVQRAGKNIHIVGYVVTTKNSSTKTHELMHFGTFLDACGEVFDTVHFPNVVKKFPFRGRGFYRIRGAVAEDFGVPTVEVHFMEKLHMISKRADEFMREPTVHPAEKSFQRQI